MIYKQSEFTKEKKQAYIESHQSRKALIWYGVILALCTFAGHFMLQTLTRSILPEAIPQYMMPSHFSTLSLYTLVALVGYTGYIARYYNYLTYAEISQNKWYTLVKLNYDPTKLIIVKLLTRGIEVIFFYTIGFIATLFLSLFLKYPFVPSYILPLFVAGLIDILFVIIITMGCSLFISEQKNARYIVVISAIVIWLLRLTTGYYDIVADRDLMSDLGNIIDMNASSYIVYFLLSVVFILVLILIRAKKIAQYTNFPFYKLDMDIEQDIKIVVLEGDSYNEIKEHQFVRKKHNKFVDRCVRLAFVTMISIGILINLFVLFVSLSSPDRETNFFGVIPFIFHTESMEPEIMYNDLAFFASPKKEEVYEVNSIVLFRDNGEPVVSKITSIDEDNLSVDILNYPDGIVKGHYEKSIQSKQIYGLYSGCSRWLGAIILFANTIFGRLLLLLVPAIMIFYYKPILAYLAKKGWMSE